jgi:hypothetical protein
MMVMRKVIALFSTVALVLSLAAVPVTAVEPDPDGMGTVVIILGEGENGETEQEPGNVEEVSNPEEPEDEVSLQGAEDGDPDPHVENVLTPDSPFYFLKRFIENVRLLLTFNREKKVELLTALVEERAKELETLNNKYAEGEITEAQLTVLEKALDALILFTAKLIVEMELPEEPEQPAEPGDEPGKEPGDAASEEGEDEEEENGEPDKYEWRISHLQSIAERAPGAAQKGLNTAIANAERQRERAIAKGKISGDETEEGKPGGHSIISNSKGTHPAKSIKNSTNAAEKKQPEKDKPAKKNQ